MANEGTFRPLKLILPRGQAPQRRSDRADGQLFDAVPDRHRRHHQGAGESVAGCACPAAHFGTHSGVRFLGKRAERLALRHATTAATAAGAPAPPTTAPARSAPWRMATPASSRWNCRNRMYAVPASRNSRCARIPRGAGKFRGGLGFRKNYRILGPCNLRHQSRPHEISAVGRAGRQGSAARPHHRHRRGSTRRAKSVDKENAYPLQPGDLRLRRDRRRRRLWLRRPSARST